MTKPTPSKVDLNESLKKLAGIVSWFEEQEEVDVEKGLEYVKEGAGLIKACKTRLSEVENEFEEIKKNLENDNGESSEVKKITTNPSEEVPF